MIYRFFIYGFIGWYMEIFWTALHSVFKKDFRLMGTTSVWMFFIYGSAVLFEPVCAILADYPVILRGVFYSILILSCEYLTGMILKKANICPWDYSESKFNIHGIIRLDYIPVWFLVGLLYERIFGYLDGIGFGG